MVNKKNYMLLLRICVCDDDDATSRCCTFVALCFIHSHFIDASKTCFKVAFVFFCFFFSRQFEFIARRTWKMYLRIFRLRCIRDDNVCASHQPRLAAEKKEN